MGLFGKVFLLVIAEIILIVACVYVHLDELNTKNESVKIVSEPKDEIIKEEPIENEPLKKMVKEEIQPIITEAKEEITKKPLVKPVEKAEPVKVEKIVETVKEVTVTTTPTITDEKVKALFDKKKDAEKSDISEVVDESVMHEVETEIANVVKQNQIIFKRLSTDVIEKSMLTIEKIAQILKENPDIKIEVGGHTDAKGDEEVNAYISKQRALSVRKLLVKYGVEKERLSAKGYGESQPIVQNDPQGYSIQNRRVEFKVIKD